MGPSESYVGFINRSDIVGWSTLREKAKAYIFMHVTHLISFPKTMACLFKLHSSNPFALLCIKKIKKMVLYFTTQNSHIRFSKSHVYPFMILFSILVCFSLGIGHTSFKLSMVLSLKFRCNDQTSIGYLKLSMVLWLISLP